MLTDRTSNARSDLKIQVDTANLARAADQLLRLISDIKVATIVQQVRESKQESSEMRAFYDVETRNALAEVTALRDAVGGALEGLEKCYYASCTRWGIGDDAQQ